MFTALLQQYDEMKSKHPDAVLLFRVGNFYETLKTDALTCSEILGITLTHKDTGNGEYVELAGFPHHALDTYLPELARAGKRVAICEQQQDPELTKKPAKRGIPGNGNPENLPAPCDTPIPDKTPGDIHQDTAPEPPEPEQTPDEPALQKKMIKDLTQEDTDRLRELGDPDGMFYLDIPATAKSFRYFSKWSGWQSCQVIGVNSQKNQLIAPDNKHLTILDTECHGFRLGDHTINTPVGPITRNCLAYIHPDDIRTLAGKRVYLSVWVNKENPVEVTTFCESDSFRRLFAWTETFPNVERIQEDEYGESVRLPEEELKRLREFINQINSRNRKHSEQECLTTLIRILDSGKHIKFTVELKKVMTNINGKEKLC